MSQPRQHPGRLDRRRRRALGFVVGGIGLMLDPVEMVIFWVGVVIVVAAGVLFAVMNKMGLHESAH